MSGPSDAVEVRRAGPADRSAILALAQRSLGWDPGPHTERHFAWKHLENPFGPSPMWVAELAGRIVGFRTFLRWELLTDAGEVRRAVRAVDTATDPDFQGRGIFTTLTLGALEELRADGIDFVFNTPNQQSRPGYLKMGWRVVGRVPVDVRPVHPRGLVRMARARTPAERGAVPTHAGEDAATVFARHGAVEELLGAGSPVDGLSTRRSPEYLRWRYGQPSLHYRVMRGAPGRSAAAVAAVFHLRRRGPAVEAVICETFVPAGRESALRPVYAEIARASGADYLLRVGRRARRRTEGRFLPAPGVGPILTGREVTRVPPEDLTGWQLTMGDVELF